MHNAKLLVLEIHKKQNKIKQKLGISFVRRSIQHNKYPPGLEFIRLPMTVIGINLMILCLNYVIYGLSVVAIF